MLIYLDNAATSGKKPQSVINAVSNALKQYSANPGRSGHTLSLNAQEQVYYCRKKCAKMFGAKDESGVVFTKNCTEALNMVIKGCTKVGDHVVVSSFEHNSVMRPLEHLKQAGIIDYDVAEVVFDDQEATVRAFERCIKSNTKLVVCTHASNVCGVVLPIKQIGEICRKKGVLFTVDAAQTAGVIDIDMTAMNIDFLCIAPHKGLYAPMGVGLLIANTEIEKTIIQGGTGSDSANLIQQAVLPEGFESGTLNVPGICGVSAGVDFVNSLTIKSIHQKEMAVAQKIFERLCSVNKIVIYNDFCAKTDCVPVIPFNVRGWQSEDVSRYLDKNGIAVRAGLHCAPSAHKRLGTLDIGAVRVSPSLYNSVQDADVLYSVLKRI